MLRTFTRTAVAAAVLASSVTLVGVSAVATSVPAAAATTPPTLAAGCTQISGPGAPVNCIWTDPASHQFTVPTGISSITLNEVVGGHGAGGGSVTGFDNTVAPGGTGAEITGNLAVTGGQTLYAVVGGSCAACADPQFNGGGQGGEENAGGGASDIRTSATDLTTRLVVAAGGGGGGAPLTCQGADGGDFVSGGKGGDAGLNGGPGADASACGTTNKGGGGGGATYGGAAGSGDGGSPQGSLGVGGSSRNLPEEDFETGGGGGGGLWGGGSGNGFAATTTTNGGQRFSGAGGGGGGGGSSLVPSGSSLTSAASTATPEISVSYQPGTVTGLRVTPATASVQDGTAQNYIVDTVDSSGAAVEEIDGNATFTPASGDTGVTCSGATCTPTAPGTHTVTVAFNGMSTTVTLSSSLPMATDLTATASPSTVTAGFDTNVTVSGVDTAGNQAAYTGTVVFHSSDPNAVFDLNGADVALNGATYTFTSADNGKKVIPIGFVTSGAQSVTATDQNNASFSGTANLTVTAGVATSLTLAPSTSTLTAGSAVNETLTAKDAYGNTATGYTGTVAFTSSDPKATLNGVPINNSFTFGPNQAGQAAFSIVYKTSGSQSVTATDSADSLTASATATVAPAATSTFAVTPSASSVTPGSAFSVSVQATDAYGNVTPAYTGTVTLKSSDQLDATLGSHAFTSSDNGSYTFTGVTQITPGTQTLTASDGKLSGTATVTVAVVQPSKLVISPSSTAVAAGTPISVTVTADGATGQPTTGYTGTVTLNSSDKKATGLTSHTFTSSDAGSYTFTGVTLKTTGAPTITATDNSSTPLSASASVTVTPGAASKISVSPSASSTTAGTAISVPVAVSDAYGNTVTGYTGTVTLTSGDPQAHTLGSHTFAAADKGAYTFTGVTLKTAGNQTLTASDGTLSGTATVAVAYSTTSAFTVTTGATGTTAGKGISMTVTAVDAYGNRVTSYRGSPVFTSTDSTATVNGTVADGTDSTTFGSSQAGTATVSVVFHTAGSQTLTATDSPNGVTGTSTPVSVSPSTASKLSLGLAGQYTAGTAGTLVVTATDAYGNVASGYRGTVSLTSSDPLETNGGSYAFTGADAGSHTFPLTFKTAGTQTENAGDGNLTAQASTTVVPGAAASLTVTPSSTSVTAGSSNTVTVVAMDSSGNVATGYTGNVTVTSSDKSATLPGSYTFTSADRGTHTFSGLVLKTPGSQTVSAGDGTLTGSATVAVTVGAAGTLSVTPAASSVTAGTATSVTVTVTDASGNAATGYTGTVTLTTGDKAAVLPAAHAFTAADKGSYTFTGVTLKTAGTQTLTATDNSATALTAGASVSVTPAAAAKLTGTLSPQYVAGVAGTEVVTATDAFGNIATAYRGAVRQTSSDPQVPSDGSSYTFTAKDAGTHTFGFKLLTAGPQTQHITDGTLTADPTTTVVPASAATLTVTLPDTITAGTTGSFTVTATDAYGNLATGYRATVTLTGSDPTEQKLGSYTFTGTDGGTHTFPVVQNTAGTQTVNATDGTLSGSDSTLVSPGPATTLTVTAGAATVTAGSSTTVLLTAKDKEGNVATGYAGTVTLTSSDKAATLPAAYTFTGADKGTHTFSGIVLKTAGSEMVTGGDGTLSGSATVTVVANTAGSLSVTPGTTSVTAGGSNSVTVAVSDASGNVATGYTGTVTLTSSDKAATLPSAYTFTAADKGAHTFTGVVLKTAGSQSIVATDNSATPLTASSSVTVTPAAAAKLTLGIATQYTAGTAGKLAVTATDAYGNVATGYLGKVSFSSSDPQEANGGSYTFTAADAGSHTFPLLFKTAGPQTEHATDGTLAADATTTVTPGPAASIAVTAANATVAAGASTSVTASVKDASGNTLTGYTGTVKPTSSDPAAVLPAAHAFTAGDKGTYTFTGVTLKTAGSQTVTAGDGTLSGVASITVTPAAAASLTVTPSATSVTAGGSATITVVAKDAAGNVATGYTGTVTLTSSDKAATLPAAYTFTGADAGTHTFSGIVLKTAGSQTLTATDDAKTPLTGSTTVTVRANRTGALSVTPATGSLTAGTTTSVTVTVDDASGNPVTGYTGTVALTSSDKQAVLPAAYTFTSADKGTHTFTNVVLKTAGGQTLTATDNAATPLTASGSITVTPAAAAALALTGLSSNVTAGANSQVKLAAIDAYGNLATGYRGTVTVTTTDPGRGTGSHTFTTADNGVWAFTLTFDTAGPQSVHFTDGTLSADAATTVAPGAASALALTSSDAIASGQATTIGVRVADTYGNTVTGYTGTVSVTSSDPQATLPAAHTFTAADTGAYTFTGIVLRTAGAQTVIFSDGSLSKTATLNVDAAGESLSVTPASSSIVAGTPTGVTVQALSAGGSVDSSYTGTVAFTSTDAKATLPAAYTFTAADGGAHTFSGVSFRTAGPQTVTATDGAGLTAKTTLSVTPGALATLSLSPSSSSVTLGNGVSYTATGADAYGNSLGDVTASTTLSISPDGFCVSNSCKPAAAGQHTITGADGSIVATASLTASAAGTTPPPPAPTTTAPAAITIKAPKKTISYGQKITLTGKLTRGGAAVAGQKVFLTVTYTGSKAKPLGTATTAADGSWHFTTKPGYDGTLTASALGSSAKVKLSVAETYVGLRATVSGHTVTITGKLTPGFVPAKNTRLRYVVTLHEGKRVFTTVAKAPARHGASSSAHGYAPVSVTFTLAPGSYKLSLTVSGVPASAAAASRALSVKVR